MEKVSDYSRQENKPSDEIDLGVLGLCIINALKRNFNVLIFFVVLGALFGYWYYYITPSVYKTSMIANSKLLTNVRVANLVKVLNDLAEESNADQLARKMHINPVLAQTIKSIEAKSILSERLINDKLTELDNNVFEITLSTFSNQHLDSLQAGILYYLQHNDFVEKRTAIQKQNLETMLSRVREEVNKLDSLRFSVNQLLNKGVGSNSTMLMSDPASVNKDIMALYERELNINAELQLIDDIQVIQDFTQFNNPTSPKLIKTLAASTSSAFILALIIVVILEMRRGIRKLKRQVEQESLNEKELT